MFVLPRAYADEMIAHAWQEAPNECCGLLAGVEGRIVRLYRTTNAAGSPTQYRLDPREQFAIHKDLYEKGWHLVGGYHSHTHTEAYPSATDVKLAFWPDILYFIVSLADPSKPVIRAFRIREAQILEEELVIGDLTP